MFTKVVLLYLSMVGVFAALETTKYVTVTDTSQVVAYEYTSK